MYDARTNLSNQVVKEVKKYFNDKVYKTVIPRNVRLSEAQVMECQLQNTTQGQKVQEVMKNLQENFLK